MTRWRPCQGIRDAVNQKTAKLLRRYTKHLKEDASHAQIRSAKRKWNDGTIGHRPKGQTATVMKKRLGRYGRWDDLKTKHHSPERVAEIERKAERDMKDR